MRQHTSMSPRKLVDRLYALRTCLRKMSVDAAVFALAWAIAYFVRLDVIEYPESVSLALTLPFVVALKLAVFHYVGSYRSFWRYSGMADLQRLLLGTALAGVAVATLAFMVPRELVPPRSVPFIDAALALLMMGGVRMAVRVLYEAAGESRRTPRVSELLTHSAALNRRGKRALIVGAGDSGERIVRELLRSTQSKYRPVAFVDDNPSTHVQRIHGIPVAGSLEAIPELVREFDISEVLIAIPSARGKVAQKIVRLCRDTSVSLRILSKRETIDGKTDLPSFRVLDVNDLLGRQPVKLDLESISAYLKGKRVLVTGAGGSIGSELCRQILPFAPAELHLLGRGENSIYLVHQELVRTHSTSSTRLNQIIGDVINKPKIEGVFEQVRPEIVFHAGADKHVPLMESNPDEAVLNNIVGTKNILEVANAHGVERVVCVSTDKAVNPTSIMGCCKRVGEMLIQSNMFPNIRPVAVRFANVLGSRGSVVPLFEEQIREGGPITLTDRNITRYFMTIPEAASLVIQAGAIEDRGGEIFVLDMGEPIRISDLAENMIRLAGLEPGEDIEIQEIGLRPGEKMTEELVGTAEVAHRTSNARIIGVQGREVDPERLLAAVESMRKKALVMDFDGIRRDLQELVPEFEPAGEAPSPEPAPETVAPEETVIPARPRRTAVNLQQSPGMLRLARSKESGIT